MVLKFLKCSPAVCFFKMLGGNFQNARFQNANNYDNVILPMTMKPAETKYVPWYCTVLYQSSNELTGTAWHVRTLSCMRVMAEVNY